MAMVLIEKSNGIKGYISIKQSNSKKLIDYYIEIVNPPNMESFDIVYINNNEGYIIKNIKPKLTLKEKNIYQGSINNIKQFKDDSTDTINEGVCIINKEKEMLFGEYFNKKPFKIENINLNQVYKNNLTFKDEIKELVATTEEKETSHKFKLKNNRCLKKCTFNIRSKNINKEFCSKKLKNNSETKELIETSDVDFFVNNLSNKATTVKNIKIQNKNDLTMKISYFIFKSSIDKSNKYYLVVDSIVNIFKSNIKKYGHFLISIIFKKNGEIKYIQIGVPDKLSSLNIQSLNSIKYKQIEESDCGYWFLKYEF